MKVTPIAYTMIDWAALNQVAKCTKFGAQAFEEFEVSDLDHLGEFAGRACYKSFGRERQETATTETYLRNILDQGHYSVLEHGSVTFWVEGVSRSLLTELERHRFLSFSVESQRYVNQCDSHPVPVIPPAIESSGTSKLWAALHTHYGEALDRYDKAVIELLAAGYDRKQAREAARAFLPNATPVDFVVTGNLRCWRDVLGKRYHVEADAEIRLFAAHVLNHLRTLAPYSVQDIPGVPYGRPAEED